MKKHKGETEPDRIAHIVKDLQRFVDQGNLRYLYVYVALDEHGGAVARTGDNAAGTLKVGERFKFITEIIENACKRLGVKHRMAVEHTDNGVPH